MSGFLSPPLSFASLNLDSELRDQLSRLPAILRAALRMSDGGPSNAIIIAFVLPFFPGNRSDHTRKLAKNKGLYLANGYCFVRFRFVRFHVEIRRFSMPVLRSSSATPFARRRCVSQAHRHNAVSSEKMATGTHSYTLAHGQDGAKLGSLLL